MSERRSLEDWLRLAYNHESDCPPPETFHRSLVGDLSPNVVAKLQQHTARCSACAAEQDLARLFDVPDAEIASRRRDVDAIVAGLVRRSPVGGATETVTAPGATVGRLPWSRLVVSTPAWSLAAAALAVLGIGMLIQTRLSPPTLPDPTGSVVRGSHLEIVAPVGDVEVTPAQFRWIAVEGSKNYRLTLIDVGQTVLWEQAVAVSAAQLPVEIRDLLHPMVAYSWKVEALDEHGARLAWSDWVRFRIVSAAESGTVHGMSD